MKRVFLLLAMIAVLVASCENDEIKTPANDTPTEQPGDNDNNNTTDEGNDENNDGGNDVGDDGSNDVGGNTDNGTAEDDTTDDGNSGNNDEVNSGDESTVPIRVRLTVSDITENSFTLNISSRSATEVRYICAVKGSKSIDYDMVMSEGNDVTANTTVKIPITGLTRGTAYDIYCAACNDKEETFITNIEARTLGGWPELDPEYGFGGNLNVELRPDVSEDGLLQCAYISFHNFATGITLFLDLYYAEGDYLPAGEYMLGGVENMSCNREFSYLHFSDDYDLLRFTEGGVKVSISKDEISGATIHTFSGEFKTEGGSRVALDYSGTPEKRWGKQKNSIFVL